MSKNLPQKIAEAVGRKSRCDALYRAMNHGRKSRAKAIATLSNRETFSKEVREAKIRCQEKSDDLVREFAENAEKRGAQVFLANDGAAAIAYTLKVAQQCQAKILAKSKSLTSDEIEVNAALEENGIEVIETDLGELIIQKLREKPFHLVFPSVHCTAEEVAEIFKKATGEEVPDDIDAIMKVVRKYLRPIFLNADIGMTGANVGIAETGTIVIETNEGNARLVSSIPDVHICIMGREKVVATIEDALKMVRAHPVSATGQPLTTYVTFMSGRSPLGENTSRETHIIILDNGRTQMLRDPVLHDALNCIRCGACMNICPTYGVVGGHTFGYIYPGPIGIPWTAGVHGQDKADEFASLCISCGLCKEICPAEIDIPMMIAEVKHRSEKQSLANRLLMKADTMARFGSATAPFSNWVLQNKAFRWGLEKIAGIDRRRQLPPFQRPTLRRLWRSHLGSFASSSSRNVLLFADTYFHYNAPHLAIRAAEILAGYGCRVVLAQPDSSGYPYIGYGDLDGARRIAKKNIARMAIALEKELDIVALEPTAAYALQLSYPKLLQNDDQQLLEQARKISHRTSELFAYLQTLEREGQSPPFPSLAGKRLGFHISCHQRAIGSAQHTIAWLRSKGAEVEVVETGTCCGMGGTFGMKAGWLGYDLSREVGAPLFDAFKKANVSAIVTESSVCSIHLREAVDLPLYNPLELLLEYGETP